MLKNKIIALVMFILVLSLLAASACSSQTAVANTADNVTAKQVSIQPEVNGDIITIPLSEVEKNTNTRFTLQTPSNTVSFMAYKYNDQIHVRADICPPCGSESFTLKNGTLVCDTCGTVFEAETGDGIKGACVRFAKQAVPFENKDGNIIMNGADLVTAFNNTVRPQ